MIKIIVCGTKCFLTKKPKPKNLIFFYFQARKSPAPLNIPTPTLHPTLVVPQPVLMVLCWDIKLADKAIDWPETIN